MSKDTGGQAFPCEQGHTPDGSWNQSFEPGMTLRDWFAGQAISSRAMETRADPDNAVAIANRAYMLADAMLKAREVQS